MMYFFAIIDNKGFCFLTGTGTKSLAREHKERINRNIDTSLALKIKYFNSLEERTNFLLSRRNAL